MKQPKNVNKLSLSLVMGGNDYLHLYIFTLDTEGKLRQQLH